MAHSDARNPGWGWAYREYVVAYANDNAHAGDAYPQLVAQLVTDLNEMHPYDAQLAQVEFTRHQPPSGNWTIALNLWWPQQATYS